MRRASRGWEILEVRASKVAQGEQEAISRLFQAEHLTRSLLQEKVNQISSNARSARNTQDLEKPESTDMALRESNKRMHSHRVEPYQANQVCENSRRASLAPCRIGEWRKRSPRNSQWNAPRKCRNCEGFFCTLSVRIQRLRMDEPSR